MRPPATRSVDDVSEVGPAFAGHPVGFALCTREDRQFVAYYDADRRLTAASRRLGTDDWTAERLPERVGWDSHNDVVLAVDDAGHVHLSGNVHNAPLVYFRTDDPLDVTSFERVDSLVGRDEERVTYPRFVAGPDGDLVFMYRDGGSGDGRRLLNAFDPETEAWWRPLDVPLLDGRGEMNAYPEGPVRGPDGDYHLAWVWRDTPDAATTHDVSYARSPDLVDWERADGTPLDLPITIDDGAVVDPVPAGEGLINDNVAVGFDADDRPVVSYHRFGPGGNTQVYNARFEGTSGAEAGEGWRRVRASDWDYRWDVGGRGSIDFAVAVDPVRSCADGLVQPYWHAECGPGRWTLDAETLDPTGTDAPWHGLPDEPRRVEGEADGLAVQWVRDWGRAVDAAERTEPTHLLRWESLPANRDRERDDVPEPTTLRVYAVS